MRKNLLLFALSFLMLLPLASYSASSTKDVKDAASQVSNEPAVGTVQDALKEFKGLSKKERKDRIKDAKKELNLLKEKKAAGDPSVNTALLVVLAILLPPLAVYLHEGVINGKFWLDLILTLLFYLPGMIYALIVVLS
jgi:uncharacterized membrane protein YqaE (UPF0057 family)